MRRGNSATGKGANGLGYLQRLVIPWSMSMPVTVSDRGSTLSVAMLRGTLDKALHGLQWRQHCSDSRNDIQPFDHTDTGRYSFVPPLEAHLGKGFTHVPAMVPSQDGSVGCDVSATDRFYSKGASSIGETFFDPVFNTDSDGRKGNKQ